MVTPSRSMWTGAFWTSRSPTQILPVDAHPLGHPCCQKPPDIFRFTSERCNPCRQGQCWCAIQGMKILDHQVIHALEKLSDQVLANTLVHHENAPNWEGSFALANTHVALRRFTFYRVAWLGFPRFYPASLGESRRN